MRKGLQLFILAPVLLLGAANSPARAESPVKAGASWVNEYGTVMRIDEVMPTGRFSGTVTSRTGCGSRRAQPMTGWYVRHGDGGAISFTVHWKGCNSLTVWIGRIITATGGFQAQWSLAGAAVPPGSGVVVGSNLFKPREAAGKADTEKPAKKPRKRRRR